MNAASGPGRGAPPAAASFGFGAGGHAGPVILMTGLTRVFEQAGEPVRVLRGINLRIEQGEFVAIQGPSGSGKSTLLHILGLLDRPSSGSYALDGHDVSSLDDDALSAARNKLTGFVFQNFYLIPYATALDNVLLPGLYSDKPMRALRERAEFLLERVGLADRMDFTPPRLSGGQQQRVALARALLNDPALLLADEPTGQLDSATSNDILDLFEQVNAAGKTVVVVTHDELTAARARRRVIIRDGEIDTSSADAGAHGSDPASANAVNSGVPGEPGEP